MHIPLRTRTVLFAGAGSCILAFLGVLSPVSLRATLPFPDPAVGALQREAHIDALQGAIHQSASATRSLPGIVAQRIEGEEELAQAEQALSILGTDKRNARLAYARKLAEREQYRQRYGIDPADTAALRVFLDGQLVQVQEALRQYARAHAVLGHVPGPSVTVLLAHLSDASDAPVVYGLEESLRYRTLSHLRMRTMVSLWNMEHFFEELDAARIAHEDALGAYHAAMAAADAAKAKIAHSDARLAEIRQIVAAVEERIRQMQSSLAEYDARIRERAEGALIAKGLLSKRSAVAATPRFQWPVTGRLTATFLDSDYHAFFGIPHKAIDIAQPQGSPVRSAAEGIVHYVQHGGASGYSYILIGHRGGYATLYGHMLDMYVAPGDDVDAGQVIGLSGGQPGTPGAGPMTTGPHLHLEIIKDGVHLDPLMLLP